MTDKKTAENIKLIWDAINDIKESLKNLVISVNKSTGNSNEKQQTIEKRKERSQDSQDNTKKQSMNSSSNDKHQKEKKPRQTSIKDYYRTIKNFHGCIEKRLGEMESKVIQLEKAKLSLQVEVNSLKKENSELKKKLASSEIHLKLQWQKLAQVINGKHSVNKLIQRRSISKYNRMR